MQQKVLIHIQSDTILKAAAGTKRLNQSRHETRNPQTTIVNSILTREEINKLTFMRQIHQHNQNTQANQSNKSNQNSTQIRHENNKFK
jgi:hypothetical protein